LLERPARSLVGNAVCAVEPSISNFSLKKPE
jgi:hypothetical protein